MATKRTRPSGSGDEARESHLEALKKLLAAALLSRKEERAARLKRQISKFDGQDRSAEVP